MKLKITTEQHPAFLKAIQQAETVSQTSKTVIQALGAVLITAKLGSISIQANNLERAIVASVPATVTVPGQVGISAKDLSLIAKLGKSLEIAVTKSQAIIKCGGTFWLPIIVPEEFPTMPSMGEEITDHVFTRKDMAGILACVYAASPPNDNRYVLQGVCVNPESGQGVASDARRLACSSSPVSKAGWGPIIPTAACRILDSLIGGFDSIKMKISPAHLSVEVGETTFFTRLVEGTFPNVAQTIPVPSFAIKVKRKDLIAAIDRVLVALSDHNCVKITLSKSEVTLTVVGKNANAETSVDLEEKVPKEAIDFAITVNSGFLRDAAGSMKDDVVSLEFVDKLSPMAVNADAFAIIMPMRNS